MAFFNRLLCAACAVVFVTLPAGSSPTQCRADERGDFFERHIRPLLIQNCVGCHGPKKQEADLRLDSRQQVLQGTSEVPALVVPGNPEQSRLYQVLQYHEDDVQMPPKERLPAEQVQQVGQWIAEGAIWPNTSDFGREAAVESGAWRSHWAFQPITDPPLPAIGDDSWHPVDRFIRDRLRTAGLTPSPLADASTLVRRVSYAVTGLPPEIDDIRAAQQVPPEQTFAFITEYTDRLLQSPQYGERWARYWLDIARYADTKGYVFREEREYKEAWKFRDWVINAINNDMPYDEFLKRQIAADQLPGGNDGDQLAAMGFLTLGRRFLNNKHDIIDDRIDVLCRGTMALTVTCARCHDHKYDPIPAADYYALYGVFASSHEPGDEPSALRLVDHDRPREPYVFLRGQPNNRGPRVTRHFLTALSAESPPPAFRHGSGRLELAENIASPDNPLTARVAVNRIWLRLFGQALVDQTSDFGVRTAPPSHPELLDHLATWFIKNQWSRRKLIRYLMLSYAWRQSSAPRPEAAAVDPENRLLARMNRLRLDFEAWRDSLLSASGKLETQVGGPSVDITSQPFSGRRTVYARIDRQNLPGLFRTFDFASPDSHMSRRFQTTVPQQGLYQFNSRFVYEQAERAANASSGDSPETVVRHLYHRVLRRDATADEIAAGVTFLESTAAAAPVVSAGPGWHYGYGEIDDSGQQVTAFHYLPVFKDGRWGGAEKMPDKRLGWCSLVKDGGHPGHNRALCSIRRWVADRAGEVVIRSQLRHPSAQGDGVTAHVLAGGRSLASASVHNSGTQLNVSSVHLSAGDTLDFVVECNGTDSFDSYNWKITLVQTENGLPIRTWNSVEDFSSEQPLPLLPPAAQLAQVLMMTNEFMFID